MPLDTTLIENRIEQAMRCDQFRLRRELKNLRRDDCSPEQLDGFRDALEASVALREQRAASIPEISYPEDLPVSAHRGRIVDLIRSNQVVIVCGETGSGKSTQLPKLCLEAGLGASGMIGHTQPRRIAARSIAARISDELSSPLGELVGFKIRFDDKSSPTSLIKLMTDGILLAETQSDRFLEQYDAIILDEAHERSLNIDFLLGILHRILQKRKDLRLIITSATIDADRFANHFGEAGKVAVAGEEPKVTPAPIITVEGRSYPVDIRYLSENEVIPGDGDRGVSMSAHVCAGLDEVFADGPGDVLVFLPTERDIRETARHIGGHLRRQGYEKQTDLLPLYARLPASEQQKIFQGSPRRRIVLATNVAESSLTVPGIRYVIDTGTARISRYSARSKVQRLPIEAVSRASAAQRAGRCGRVGPGVCIRLYDEDDYQSRDAFTTPEIRRTNLASVILQTMMLRLGSIDEFPFLDAPRPEAIREGYRTLHEIGAINDHNELTSVGRTLGSIPVDPRVGRMIIEADRRGCLPEVLVIAAALEIQDPRVRPPERKEAADAAHAQFVDSRSDFLSYLRLWRFYRELQGSLSRSRFTRACQKHFLSPNRLREWADVHRQLRALIPQIREKSDSRRRSNRRGKKHDQTKGPSLSDPRVLAADAPDQPSVEENLYTSIHQSLLTGLLSGVATAGDRHEYTGIGGQQFYLWPGSGVFEGKPKWIVAGELVETTKQYVRNVARIDQSWLEPLAEHLVKRNYFDPFWSRKAQSAMCYERVTLFGLPIVVKRRKPLAPIDPDTSRRMLIEQGLIAGELESRARFYAHNQQLRDVIARLADKTRRRDLIVDDYRVDHFYQSRIPTDVVDRPALERLDKETAAPEWASYFQSEADVVDWLGSPTEMTDDADSLYMRPSDLLPDLVEALDPEAFPDHLSIGPTDLPLSYNFDPSSSSDGVSITIPKVVLAQVSEDRLGWLIPGLLHDKIVGLIKALPKRIRRNLVPAADTATKIIEELGEDVGRVPFMPTICDRLSRVADMPIRSDDFDEGKLSDSWNFFVRVVDDDGKAVAEGRDIRELQYELGSSESDDGEATAGSADDQSDDAFHEDGLKDFTLDDLPQSVTRQRGGVRVALFPALLDRGDNVSVRLLDNKQVAQRKTTQGVIRLFALAEKGELNKQIKWMPGLREAGIFLAPVLSADSIKQSLIDLLANIAFVERKPSIRTRDEFQQRRKTRGESIAMAAQEVAKLLMPLAEQYHEVRLMLEKCKAGHLDYARKDIRIQLQSMFGEGFLTATSLEQLKQYPRYLKAICQRLDKITSSGGRDREAAEIIERFREDHENRLTDPRQDRALLDEYRWMIEELRVSLFAQSLGTAIKVSPQRLEKLMTKMDKAASA